MTCTWVWDHFAKLDPKLVFDPKSTRQPRGNEIGYGGSVGQRWAKQYAQPGPYGHYSRAVVQSNVDIFLVKVRINA